MYKIILITALLLVSFNLCSQELSLQISRKTGKFYPEFGSGVKYYTGNFGEKLNDSFIKDLYYEGKDAYGQKNYVEAKRKLLEFMDKEISENDMNENGLPNNMVLKYQACLMLKEIYYIEKNYKRSLYYNNYKANFVMWGTCGFISFDITEEDIYYFTCYENTANNYKAIMQILWKIIYTSPVDEQIVKRLVSLLKINYPSENLKLEMLNSLNNINTKLNYATFINQRLYVRFPRDEKFTDVEKRAIIKEIIQNHLFYKLITEE